ncbi:hypothetical protein DMH26_00190 [Streptomyces sp. WAC 05379]|uniref:tetratricopeptide repeat protein n=1 Tax=Streptomyces sp. WAC 05379 TaxID=2203207 RepID=UPI000F73FC6F|nr:tetratricopeptide repeat protein [Streptomyces sp. WAC 05379]RSO09966.1 hypothetical protein DMH26_00190 [Streptomyces sp. WAC 05379]
MEFDRRVQVRVRKGVTGKRGFGSGYLIAPRLVLTAAHVLDGIDSADPDALTVTKAGIDRQDASATVRWQRMNETIDAALIEVTDGRGWQTPESLSNLLSRPPQRFGLIIGTQPQPVTLAGFPRMQKAPDDGQRLDEQLTGHISPGSGSLAGRYEVFSTDPTLPVDPATGPGSRWSGVSGAALLADDGLGGDMLCGVVRRDRQASGGTRLTATPAGLLLADDDFRALTTQHTGWEPVLEPVEPASLLAPAATERDLNSPAALLRADAEAVTFHGRRDEITDLCDWCETSAGTVLVRVLTGPGGQGKTRLTRHLTDILSHTGWAAGHLRSDLTDQDVPPDFAPLTTALPLLIVVDYAEARPRLVRRLLTHLHRSRHRVRLLLLARSDGEWRTDALNALPTVRRLLTAAPVTELAPLIPRSRPAQDRLSAFTRAAKDFARLLPCISTMPTHDWMALAATLQPPDDLRAPRYDNALTLQLTALVTLLQRGPAPTDTALDAPAEEILLDHEQRFWEDTAKAPAFKLDLPTTTLASAVAVAALCGAATKQDAAGVISKVPDLPADKTSRAAAWLAALYPAEPERYWGSLQPDRIAEYHTSRTLIHSGLFLPDLLAASTPGQQAQIIIILARAAIAHYNAGRTTDSDDLLETVNTVLDTTSLAYQALQTATAALPYPSRVTSSLSLRLTHHLAQANQQLVAEDPAPHVTDLATSLSNLGSHLSAAGRRSEALTATEQASRIWRRLVAEDPATYEPDLARSLSNLGSHLSAVGRRAEALTATEQALEIRRRLAAAIPAAYEPDLATSLSNLGSHLSAVGRRAEALNAEQQAVEIWRRLAADDPAAYEPDLAHSLSNLGGHLWMTGLRREALTVTERAVDIYEHLAADNPAAYEPDLATSLYNWSINLSAVGLRPEALTATGQAVEIWRRLAAYNPAAYEPDLARSLSNLGNDLSEAGRWAEALTETEQAVDIYEHLAMVNPAVYEPDHAGSLSNLGNRLWEAGRWAEALTAEQQAVEIRRRLAADNPATHEPDLATSLSNLGNHLLAAGRPAEALTATEQALEIRRRLATVTPAAHESDLAASLSNLGSLLSEARRWTEARTAVDQAVEIWRRLAVDNPAVHEPDLALSLAILSMLLERTGDLPGALRTTGEAVELYRRHVATMPSILPQLHAVLGVQATVLEGLGHQADAEQVRLWLRENRIPPDSHS